jgi:hypothetical protein
MRNRQIFVNYRRSDAAGAAGRLTDALGARFGRSSVFMDVDAIPPGADFVEFLERVVASSTVMLVVIGRAWLRSQGEEGQRRLDNPTDFVRVEIETALGRGLPLIPVLVDDAPFPREEDIPPSLRPLLYRQAVSLRHSSFQADVDHLAENLSQILGEAQGGPGAAVRRASETWGNRLRTWLGQFSVGKSDQPTPTVEQGSLPQDSIFERLQDLVREARRSKIALPDILARIEKVSSDLLGDGATIQELEEHLGAFPTGKTLPIVNARLEVLLWERAIESRRPSASVEYLTRFPHGTYVAAARSKRDQLITETGGFDPGTPRIFLNYRRLDSQDTADRIYAVMSQAVPPQNITMDVDKKSIVPGLPVDTQLQRLVCECDVMFTLINSRWIDELRRRAPQHETGEQIDFVRAELKYALERGDAMPVIPILADTVEHPRGTDLPEDIRALSRRSSVHLSRDKFAEDVLDLFRQVAMHLGKTQPLMFRN